MQSGLMVLDDNELLNQIKNLIMENRRLFAIARDLISRYASLSEDARASIQNQQALEEILREAFEVQADQLSDIETYILAIATNTQQSRKATKATDSIQRRQDMAQLRKLLTAESENRNRIMLQIAKQGGEATASVSLISRLEKVEENISRIEAELNE
jgi:vacuolar-type H+-ATPase catalytic subunit A/Vma1